MLSFHLQISPVLLIPFHSLPNLCRRFLNIFFSGVQIFARICRTIKRGINLDKKKCWGIKWGAFVGAKITHEGKVRAFCSSFFYMRGNWEFLSRYNLVKRSPKNYIPPRKLGNLAQYSTHGSNFPAKSRANLPQHQRRFLAREQCKYARRDRPKEREGRIMGEGGPRRQGASAAGTPGATYTCLRAIFT